MCNRFPVSGLSDGKWHHVAVSVSARRLALYVDCSLLESVDWVHQGMGITADGLLMVGGIIEGFETPFEVSHSAAFLFDLLLYSLIYSEKGFSFKCCLVKYKKACMFFFLFFFFYMNFKFNSDFLPRSFFFA